MNDRHLSSPPVTLSHNKCYNSLYFYCMYLKEYNGKDDVSGYKKQTNICLPQNENPFFLIYNQWSIQLPPTLLQPPPWSLSFDLINCWKHPQPQHPSSHVQYFRSSSSVHVHVLLILIASANQSSQSIENLFSPNLSCPVHRTVLTADSEAVQFNA